MKIYNIRPNKRLQPYIDRYWLWEDESDLPKLIPGTGTELMFHFHEPITTYRDHCDVKIPRYHILSLRYDAYDVKTTGRNGFIAARFRAGAFRNFCNEAISEIIDSFVDVQDLWGKQGIECGNKVVEAKTVEQRIVIIEDFLMRCLDCFNRREQGIDYMVNKIYYGYNTILLREISNELGISNRHFQRKFKETVGVSPKAFQRIARFESILKHLLLNKKDDYLNTALDSGYYDQSHFIKDFKSLTGECPSLFLQEKNFMSHFYNKKLLM